MKAQQANTSRTNPAKWSPTNDVLTDVHFRLVRAKCQAYFQRPKKKGKVPYNYYLHYSVVKTKEKKVDGKVVKKNGIPVRVPVKTVVRPFILRRANVDLWDQQQAPDPELVKQLQKEKGFKPRKSKSISGWKSDAPHASAADASKLEWPLRPSLNPVPAGTSYDLRLKDSPTPVWKSFHGLRSPSKKKKETKHRAHGGVDLYAAFGDPVVAVAKGQIVSFGGPCVPGTCFPLVYHETLKLTINYGEVHHESLLRMGLMVGDTVKRGLVIAAVGQMWNSVRFQHSMLHFETLGDRLEPNKVVSWWNCDKDTRHTRYYQNPTKLLLAIRQAEHDRRKKKSPSP